MDGEIVDIINEQTVQIIWTPDRQSRFGQFPEVECYLQDEGGTHYKAAVQPVIDNPPPGFSIMTFEFTQPENGFILIK